MYKLPTLCNVDVTIMSKNTNFASTISTNNNLIFLQQWLT